MAKTGKVVWRSDELPFGEEYDTQETPERNDRRFLGKQLDKETGLICMGKRYLDPRTGRFTQLDPVGLADPATGKVNQEMLLNPQRLNRYVYALNNPYKYVDPEGDWAETVADIYSLQEGYRSYLNNLSKGDYRSAAVDIAGIVVDAISAAAPGIYVGAGVAIKASRVSGGISLTKKAARNLGNLTDLKDVNIARAIRDRGGNASNVRKALGDNFAGKTVGEIANISATKGKDATQAKRALKILKQAKKKGQRY